MNGAPYEIVLSRAARRALEFDLPEGVAAAALEFILGALCAYPYRVGKPLRAPMEHLHSARRGQYRVIYQIVDRRLIINIVSVVHRRDAYRR